MSADTIKRLYTVRATATGGRNGHSRTSDRAVSVDLSVPEEMGGPGRAGTATPEHLFAAGYAACFGGALDFVASRAEKDASKAAVTCAVSIGPREGGGSASRWSFMSRMRACLETRSPPSPPERMSASAPAPMRRAAT